MSEFTFVLGLATVGAAAYTIWSTVEFLTTEFPDVRVLRSRYPRVVYAGANRPWRIDWSRERPAAWTSYENVSRNAIGAIIVSEDWSFFTHPGYDAAEIRESLLHDIEKGRFARGASTITQQVVKNVFLERDKNLWRKLKEVVLAVQLEGAVSKSKILEVYLNVVEWGEGVFGIEAASRLYFKKAPSELTPKEGAFLAMLLPSPIKYSQSYKAKRLTDYAARTIDRILFKMSKAKYLTEAERVVEVGKRLSFETGDMSTPAPHQEGDLLGFDLDSKPEPEPSALPSPEVPEVVEGLEVEAPVPVSEGEGEVAVDSDEATATP